MPYDNTMLVGAGGNQVKDTLLHVPHGGWGVEGGNSAVKSQISEASFENEAFTHVRVGLDDGTGGSR